MYSKEIVCKVIRYIDINLFSKITLEDIVKYCHYNKFYLVKLFKKEMKFSIFDYINRLRIYYSFNMLKNSDRSLTRIALECGFYSLEYFSEIFKKIVGVSPSKYRKYINNRFDFDEEIAFLINTKIIELQSLIERKLSYLNNVKPSTIPIKKLTIFK